MAAPYLKGGFGGEFMRSIELIIYGLRCNGATIYDIDAEIDYREKHFTVNDEKCFAYSLEELKLAKSGWNIY